MPASPLQLAKRALVAVILALAAAHNIVVEVSRESPDDVVRKTFRKVCMKVHPDKGGSVGEQQRSNAAKEAWEAALRQGTRRGRPRKAAGQRAAGRAEPRGGANAQGAAAVPAGSLASDRKVFRVQSEAVLLTYQGFSGLDQWVRFLAFVRGSLKSWKVMRWCATLESNRREGYRSKAVILNECFLQASSYSRFM